MRQIHGMEPPAPGRGSTHNGAGNTPGNSASVVSNSANPGLVSRFVPGKRLKPDEPDVPRPIVRHGQHVVTTNPWGAPPLPQLQGKEPTPYEDDDQIPRSPLSSPNDPESEGIPLHLWELRDPQTGLIMGRSPAMVRYLIIKAKHKHALQEHECLIEELRAVRAEQNYWYEKKEGLLDEFLKANFGCVSSFCDEVYQGSNGMFNRAQAEPLLRSTEVRPKPESLVLSD